MNEKMIPINYQDQRRAAIEASAYALLAEKGYKATSMLAIARRAAASNETLYKWYGNKQALFASLVEANARNVTHILTAKLEDGSGKDALSVIALIGPLLLSLVTSERAVALNRAAAGDVHDTATLGKIIAESGRNHVLPLVYKLFEMARDAGQLAFEDGEPVAEIWFNVLVGDMQISRAIGARSAPDDNEIAMRNDRASQIIMKLYGS